jgi:antitoxin (DNA-binding transcriptional repressor) of toxin-antitoxin stability system
MKTVNIHEAKTHLSKLLEMVERGEPFIIARAGKPVAKVEAFSTKQPQRLGFLEGQFEVPDDFDTMFQDEIADMFEGKYDKSGLSGSKQ